MVDIYTNILYEMGGVEHISQVINYYSSVISILCVSDVFLHQAIHCLFLLFFFYTANINRDRDISNVSTEDKQNDYEIGRTKKHFFAESFITFAQSAIVLRKKSVDFIMNNK